MTTAAGEIDFDLVVLGGGSGGLAGAFRAAQHGARVALLEPGALGGTCVNAGCVPKKAMWIASDLSDRIALAARLGFDVPPSARLDWRGFIADRQRYIHGIHGSYRKRLDEAGIALLPTRGRLHDAHTVACEDGTRLRAGHVLLATGARPRTLDVPGGGLAWSSDDFFGLCDPPGRVAMIGGGYIAVELAGVLQALGSRVDLYARSERLLSHADAELAAQLAENYRQQGVHLAFGYRLAGIGRDGGQLRLHDEGGATSDAYDVVISAVGRQANTTGLGLEQAGVALDGDRNVVVDAQQRTALDPVSAVGDVTGKVTLTPVAIAAARKAMDRVFGGQPDARLDYDNIASVVFAHPPLAAVGLTEAEARARHGDDDVHAYRVDFRPMAHALADRPVRSLFKLVCVGEDRRVAGIHLLGDGADEILQGFAVAMRRGITLDDLHETVAIHPTSAEELVLMR